MSSKQQTRKTKTAKSRRKSEQEPVELRLSFSVRTGDDPEDQITILDEQEIHMVDNVFKYRDKAGRFLAFTLVKVAATNRKVMQEIVPALRVLNRMKR